MNLRIMRMLGCNPCRCTASGWALVTMRGSTRSSESARGVLAGTRRSLAWVHEMSNCVFCGSRVCHRVCRRARPHRKALSVGKQSRISDDDETMNMCRRTLMTSVMHVWLLRACLFRVVVCCRATEVIVWLGIVWLRCGYGLGESVASYCSIVWRVR